MFYLLSLKFVLDEINIQGALTRSLFALLVLIRINLVAHKGCATFSLMLFNRVCDLLAVKVYLDKLRATSHAVASCKFFLLFQGITRIIENYAVSILQKLLSKKKYILTPHNSTKIGCVRFDTKHLFAKYSQFDYSILHSIFCDILVKKAIIRINIHFLEKFSQ